MSALVETQLTALSKALVTEGTAVGPGACMDRLMLLAVLPRGQNPKAERALIGYEIGVCAGYMPLHVVVRNEAQSAPNKSAPEASFLHFPSISTSIPR